MSSWPAHSIVHFDMYFVLAYFLPFCISQTLTIRWGICCQMMSLKIKNAIQTNRNQQTNTMLGNKMTIKLSLSLRLMSWRVIMMAIKIKATVLLLLYHPPSRNQQKVRPQQACQIGAPITGMSAA